jgi:hypothetical protein
MDERIAPLLEAQLGLVTWEQMLGMGMSEHSIQSLVHRRELRRVRPRTYALIGSPTSWEQVLYAAVLSAGSDALASHSSAARLWSYSAQPEDALEILLEGEHRPRIKGVRVHRSTRIAPEDRSSRAGIPCTSFERTLCDCSALLSEAQLGRTLDDGLRRGVASLARLHQCAERLESGPGRHMSVVRALLAKRGVGFDPGGSNEELRVLRTLRRAGLCEPVQQHSVRIGNKTFRLDLAWPASKVFAEYYGLPYHVGATAVAYDSDRITALVAAGWLPLIFTSETTDRDIVKRTAAALEQRRVWPLTGS